MTDERWTDETEALAAEVLRQTMPTTRPTPVNRQLAVALLTALADAGLLLPPGSEVEVQRSIQGEDHLGPWISYDHDQSDWHLRSSEQGKRFERLEILTPWRPVEVEGAPDA